MSLWMLGALDAMPPVPVAPAKPAKVKTDEWIAAAATLAGGVLGGYLGMKFPIRGKTHPVLTTLNGLAIGGNVARMATGEITPRRAAENLGAHAIATTGALSVPEHFAWLGYLAGAASANLIIRRDDTFVERMDETVLGQWLKKKKEEKAPPTLAALPPSSTPTIRDAEIVSETVGGKTFVQGPSLSDVRAGKGELKNGEMGDAVTFVQKTLGVLPADAKFGDDTEAAVKKFQAAGSLPESGVVDAVTLAKIDEALKRGILTATDGVALVKGDETGVLIFGRPAWQVILAIVGVLLAGVGVYTSFRGKP